MISTIRTWINRIRFYENVTEKLLASEKMYRDLSEMNEEILKDSEKKRKQITSLRENKKLLQDEMKRLVSLLSGDTWKDGDNMMESIEAFQERKYMKEHAEDFLMIMNGNVPEMAAQELFEYFEIEMPQSKEIEDKTARALHQLWCNWFIGFGVSHPKDSTKLHKRYEELSEVQKMKYREDARYLWYTGHQNQ